MYNTDSFVAGMNCCICGGGSHSNVPGSWGYNFDKLSNTLMFGNSVPAGTYQFRLVLNQQGNDGDRWVFSWTWGDPCESTHQFQLDPDPTELHDRTEASGVSTIININYNAPITGCTKVE